MSKNLDVALDHLKAYRARQDAIVLGLNEVSKSLDADDLVAARAALRVILEMRLKQAKKRVDDREEALRISVNAMSTGSVSAEAARNIVTIIKTLVPELFEQEVVEAKA